LTAFNQAAIAHSASAQFSPSQKQKQKQQQQHILPLLLLATIAPPPPPPLFEPCSSMDPFHWKLAPKWRWGFIAFIREE
jgi:hypothetical protein